MPRPLPRWFRRFGWAGALALSIPIVILEDLGARLTRIVGRRARPSLCAGHAWVDAHGTWRCIYCAREAGPATRRELDVFRRRA